MEIETPNASDTETSSLEELRRTPTNQFPKTRVILRTRFRKMHDMATVLVGPNQVRFVLHTDLLVATSPFFAAALQGHFTESSSQTVTLPEEKPDIFEWFVQWLYTGSLMVAGPTNCAPPELEPSIGARRGQEPTKRFHVHESHQDGDLRNSQGSPKYFLLIDLYGLSDRILTTSLSNHIIDTIARLSETTNSVPTPSDTWLLYGDCCSFSGLHHCACSTRRISTTTVLDTPITEMSVDSTDPRPITPANRLRAPQPCPVPTSSSTPTAGIRPSSPLRDLILDLFTYKKTDRLLASHKDDWHPLFLRDLVVKLKRPGKDMMARHKLRDWRPRHFTEAKSCEGCRAVIGPHNADFASRPIATSHGQGPPGINAAGMGMGMGMGMGNGLIRLLAPQQQTIPPAPATNHPDPQPRVARRAARARRARAVDDHEDSETGAADATTTTPGPPTPRFGHAQRCAVCERAYCVECMVVAVEGRGLENGDARFALVGGDVGVCKPWLNWEDLFGGGPRGEREEGEEEGERRRRRRRERGPWEGVCGRYHEHGMMGG
ncbi:hypothetical protein CAC42_1193 [Sphaceloma murrayae]|uniref:BTB domain-containing protein n=1 Tax=Sphaceloma murrayae TaxID=2082308 RepID=A0A2K1R2A1_9PEZI|nr:hypothetical protein CAC42_1193 [Sphaceloma murrayae]